MRHREDELIDPEIAEQLDAIDATLAGDPVDPRFADLAELALLLAAERPEGPTPLFAEELDRRVAGRFGQRGPNRAQAAAVAGAPVARRSGWLPRAPWHWGLMPALAMTGTLTAVAVAVVLVATGGGSVTRNEEASAPPPPRSLTVAASAPTTASAKTAKASSGFAGTFFGGGSGRGTSERAGSVKQAAHVPAAASAPAASLSSRLATRPSVAASTSSPSSGAASYRAPAKATPITSGALAPAPLPNGRRIVQSSMLELGTPARRMDAVAQEVFVVVRSVNAIVVSSDVVSSSSPGGYAQFQLRIPSAVLPQALSQLSRLRYASVISRNDATQDVNSPYLSAERAITNGRAALARLRARLAAATAPSEIASLRAQIVQETAGVARAQESLTSLDRRIEYSNVNVSVQSTAAASKSRGGGFGLGKAGHDALRVLEVTAGVALIVLAALVPVALLVALLWWLGLAVQRRRRERALDLA